MTDYELTQYIVLGYFTGLTLVFLGMAGWIFFTRKKVKPKPLAVLWRVK